MPNQLRIAGLRPEGEAVLRARSRTPGQLRPFTPRTPLHTLAKSAWLTCLLGLVGVLGRACIATAHGQPDYRPQLALELAVVAAHEGALDNVQDTALVWQVVEARGRTDRERLSFLRSHSGRALGRKPCTEANCVWSVELLNAPSKTPASVDQGYWRSVRAPQWELVQRKALGLVYGVDDDRPCLGTPYSWGYAGDLDGAYRLRGLVPMGCEGTLNDGFALAPRVLSAAVAKGK